MILISVAGFGQDKIFYIHGKVVDEKNGSILAGASVFCQNTTTGTISNNEGLFALRLSNGGYDLVISYTGYQTQVLRNRVNVLRLQQALAQLPPDQQAVVNQQEIGTGVYRAMNGAE